MISLDLRTIILTSGVMGLVLSVVLLFLRLSYPKSIRGLGLWSAAPALVFLSTLLFAGRGVIPDAVSVVAANFILLLGLSLFISGTERFFGLKSSWRFWIAAVVAVTPILAWYTLVDPSFTARVITVSLLWSGMMLFLALLVWRNGPEVFATRFTTIVLMHAGVLLLRFFSAWLPLPGESLLDPSRIQTIYIVVNALSTVALGMGLILMASDRLREELEHSASHDSLTNALTRRSFIAACEQELERCRRHGSPMALLMLDIDHFKHINDTHGHQMGDRVLIDFVARIQPLLRRPDGLGRFGGEEFVVLLPETNEEQALSVAERIRARVEASGNGMPAITVSIGVTTNRPDEYQVDPLLARADQALYKAKAEGRNRIAAA